MEHLSSDGRTEDMDRCSWGSYESQVNSPHRRNAKKAVQQTAFMRPLVCVEKKPLSKSRHSLARMSMVMGKRTRRLGGSILFRACMMHWRRSGCPACQRVRLAVEQVVESYTVDVELDDG